MKRGYRMIVNDWTLREKIMGIILVVLLILFGSIYLFDDHNYPKKENNQQFSTYPPAKPKTSSQEQGRIMVDVKGAVQQPGIYQLSADSRVYQAIQAAGGLLEKADQKQLNLAQKCKDEMVVYVPRKGEQPHVSTPGIQSTTDSLININTATASELERLDSIGPSKAEAIVKFRETHGPFQSIDQLTQVPGIGKKTVDKFRDQITF